MSNTESNKLITVPDKAMPNLIRIVYAGGGPTPEILSGLYTGFTMAQKAIKAYQQLKPVHEPQVYNGAKTLTNEQEAEAFARVKKEVDQANKAEEAKDGEAKVTETKNEGGTEHVREGTDNRSESSDVPREREFS